MRRMVIALAAAFVLLFTLAGPVGADFGNGPSDPGVVERFDSPGFTFFVDFDAGLLLLVNVDSIADACSETPAGAGIEQVIFTPNGRVNGQLHDDEVPLILAPLGPPEAVCANPDAWPVIASGEGTVRANNGGFHAFGSIEEPSGQLWNVRGTFNARGETLRLAKRG